MKTLFLLAALAAGAWWFYHRRQPQAALPPAPAAQAVDNAATRYAASLQGDAQKAAETAQKMNAAVGQTEKALDDAAKQ